MSTPYNRSEALTQLLGLRARNNLSTCPQVYARLEHAAREATTLLLLNRHGRACGYIAYASLNKESFIRFLHRSELPVNGWEWNEGHLIVIADCMWKNLGVAELRRQLRNTFGRARVIAYQRNDAIRIWAVKNKHPSLIKQVPSSSPRDHAGLAQGAEASVPGTQGPAASSSQ